MKYMLISKTVIPYSTGMVANCEGLQDGIDLEATSAPIDAPEAIPSGGMRRCEWPSHFDKQTISWFPVIQFTLRSHQ